MKQTFQKMPKENKKETNINKLKQNLSPANSFAIAKQKMKEQIESINLQKEKAWNNRFCYSKVPDYDSSKDKNIIDSKKLRGIIPSAKMSGIFTNIQQLFPYKAYNNKKKMFNNTLKNFRVKKTVLNTNRELLPSNENIYYINNNKTRKVNNSCEIIPFKDVINCRPKIQNNNIYTSFKEESSKLNKLWNELCILDPYRELFNVVLSQMDDDSKKVFYQKEIESLESLLKDISNLSSNVKLRLKVLNELDLLNDQLGLLLKSQNSESNEKLLNEIIKK